MLNKPSSRLSMMKKVAATAVDDMVGENLFAPYQ